VKLYDEACRPIKQEIFHVTWDADAATKNGYEHFMLKEIHEQPDAIRDTLRGRLDEATGDVTLDGFGWTKETLKTVKKIWIVACGTAYYAGTVGKRLIEAYAKIPVETEIASEFRYRNPLIGKDDLFIAISQSGETADTLASMRLAKQKGARVLAISNVVGSSITREADDVLYTWAGPEIAVASTKAYSTQIVCMYLIAMKLGRLSGNMPQETYEALYKTCLSLPDAANRVLETEDSVKKIAEDLLQLQDVFYIGRGIDYSLSMEGALKMKEISYIHAEAYPAGELKHGPIALLEEGSVIVAICTQTGELVEKTVSNIEEVKARGAYVIGVTQQQSADSLKVCDRLLTIDPILNEAAVIPAVILLQMLAYYVSVGKGIDVDKPRNLAKSVTVE
jgi:glucosamine--fructose-6-phosphate aminotransferase (isomerizing)